MLAIKTIVCAVDFSEYSLPVAEHAHVLAKALGAEVVVAYIAPALSQYVGFHVPPNSVENFVGEIVSGAEKTMETFLAENFPEAKARGKVVSGNPAEEILSIAEKEEADLIIMGTHGRTGIDRFLFGSVAEKVVKSSHRAVLTVRP
jgi:nucleotide-binding universal stress UspA family protein